MGSPTDPTKDERLAEAAEHDEDEDDEEYNGDEEEVGDEEVDESADAPAAVVDGEDEDEDDEGDQPSKRQKKVHRPVSGPEEDDDVALEEDLSGDEVDPTLIVAGGRRARRSGAQATSSRYTAEATLASDEDEW